MAYPTRDSIAFTEGMRERRHAEDAERPKCHYCGGTGIVACRSRDGQYAFAGPVPDDAKGYFDTDCWYCDSGRPPKGTVEATEEIAASIIRDVAELPDRTSPADQPDMMLVTADELFDVILSHLNP